MSEVIKALNTETKKDPPIVTRKVDEARYLYQPGELEGGGRRRAADPIWSVGIHKNDYHIITQGIRVYYLKARAPNVDLLKRNYLMFRLILIAKCMYHVSIWCCASFSVKW